jgi:hypothetical protein
MNRTLLVGFGGLLMLTAAAGVAGLAAVERLLRTDEAARTMLWQHTSDLQQVREAI